MEQLQQEFLNRFYSTRGTVSMVELTNSRQWKEEPVIDYINRWRNLSLNCKDRLSEASAIDVYPRNALGSSLYSPRNSPQIF
ncbi:UNVERIFIED_CONTAM: hypothetical protein Slati_0994700 [Sesamum latifolium]|uniref:Retrotransposon gag domain-containing protein n=1 Tax=Sesamum latifolium TaxID=2727402 RepID=A0AAW2XXM7_9LAMI